MWIYLRLIPLGTAHLRLPLSVSGVSAFLFRPDSPDDGGMPGLLQFHRIRFSPDAPDADASDMRQEMAATASVPGNGCNSRQ